MKRYFHWATGVTFQYHQTLRVPQKWHAKISRKFSENGWNVMCNAGPIRSWSEHNPFSPQPAAQLRFFSSSARAFCIEKFSPNIAPATKSDSWTSPNIAPANVTECATWVQLHQMLRLPRIFLYYSGTLVFFDSAILLLCNSFVLLCFYSSLLWLYYSLTLFFFYSTILWLY